MSDRPFRCTSPDGLTWEDYTVSNNGTKATVVRYERDHGDTASRVWTKRMSRAEANARAHGLIDRGWTYKRT